MPGQDRTGPLGEGAMTGREMGLCKGKSQGFRRNFGRGFGKRCRRNFGNIILTKSDEKKILEAELTELEAEKSDVEKRLKGLD
ncbi:MAG: DUF5320 domain-containing protein [Candidatus Pacearchaeota archaeon]|jgi:hypothetical protein